MLNLFKKLAIAVLVVMLVSTCFTFTGSAANTIIGLSAKSLEINQPLTVTVTLNADEAMYGTSFTVTYNPEILRFDSGNNASGGAGAIKVVGTPAGGTKEVYSLNFTAIAAGSSSVAVKDVMYAADTEVSIIGATVSVTVNNVALSGNANLKSLSLSNGTLSPRFSASKTSYSVSVPYSTTQCKIYATPEDASAKVDVSGSSKLEVGQNTRTVTVTAPNGTQKVYTIVVERLKEEASSSELVTSSEPTSVEDTNLNDVVISDVSYTVLTDISGIILPTGFSATTTDYNGTQVAVAVDSNSEFVLYYLKAVDGTDAIPYTYNSNTKNFEKLNYFIFNGNYYIVSNIPAGKAAASSYYATNTEVAGQTISCFATSNQDLSDYYYFYCYFNGKYNMYRFDSKEITLQREIGFEFVSLNGDNTEDAGLIDRFNSLAVNGKIIIISLLLVVIGAIALVVLFVLKYINTRKAFGDYYDFENEDDNDVYFDNVSVFAPILSEFENTEDEKTNKNNK